MQSGLGVCPRSKLLDNVIRNDGVVTAEAHNRGDASGGLHGRQWLSTDLQPRKHVARKQRHHSQCPSPADSERMRQARVVDSVTLTLEILLRDTLTAGLGENQIPA